MINCYVFAYGDDFFYKAFSSRDIKYYIDRNAEHYFLANGRVIVHLLVSFFLWLGLDVWRIVSSLMLSGIVFFGSNVAAGKDAASKNSYLFASVIMACFIGMSGITLTRQGIYWLTGSFNYVFPVLILFIYWHILSNEKKVGSKAKIALLFFSFIAGASTEQTGLMAFGITLMIFGDRLLKSKRFDKTSFYCLFTSAAGYLTVLLAPANSYRASLEKTNTLATIELMVFNARKIIASMFFSDFMMILSSVALLCAIFSILILRKYSKNRGLSLVIACFGFAVFIYYIFIDYSGFTRLSYLIPFVLVYAFILLYPSVLIYRSSKFSNSKVPAMSFILYSGAQLMMLVSPVYGLRCLLCSIFMLSVFTSSLFIIIISESFAKDKLFKNFLMILLLIFIIFSLKGFYSTYMGYKKNSAVYMDNIAKIELYKEIGTNSLELNNFPDDVFGWVMPYHNNYYDPYFRRYFGLEEKTEIVWVK